MVALEMCYKIKKRLGDSLSVGRRLRSRSVAHSDISLHNKLTDRACRNNVSKMSVATATFDYLENC